MGTQGPDLSFSPAPAPTDNVTLQIDGVLYLRIMDPYKVSTFAAPELLSFLKSYPKPLTVSMPLSGKLWCGRP